MREDIEFEVEETVLRGWFYPTEGAKGPAPVVVMAHGFSGVKEMGLDSLAEIFASAGLSALVFDYRNFGASGGEPRQEIDPWMQIRDYQHAITYAQTRAEVDGDRIGVWGTSYSGSHAIMLGAIDNRVKCVVSQIPHISGHAVRSAVESDAYIAGLPKTFDEDRIARFNGEQPATIPVVTRDGGVSSALPSREAWVWANENNVPSWRNEITLRSMELLCEYEPGSYIQWISPTPLLLLVSLGDLPRRRDLALAAYGRAGDPKRLVTLPHGHFEAYPSGEDFDQASTEARDWFVKYLAD